MSKIGKKNIVIPKESSIKIEGGNLTITGPKGTKKLTINDKIFSTVAYKNAERSNGEKYTVIDFRTSYKLDKFTLSIILNNILDTEYSETNLVPMPGFNSLVQINYSIN